MTSPVLKSVDAVTVPVPSLDAGLAFYQNELGHELIWRNDELARPDCGCPAQSLRTPSATNWCSSTCRRVATGPTPTEL